MLKPSIGNKAIDKHLTTDTPVATEENTQTEQPTTVQETPQENTQKEATQQQQEATETEQQTNAE